MFAMNKDMEFAMPPRGVTRHKTKSAGKTYERITWRCEVEGCWYVCLAQDDSHLLTQQESHRMGFLGDQCPSPPRREYLPSGLPEIEKLWRELDDVTNALIEKVPYRSMTDVELKAYAMGLSFSIVMKDKQLFQSTSDVAKESMARWKMRNNKLEYRKTPTTQNTNGSWQVAGGWSESEHGSVENVKPKQKTPAATKHKLNPDQEKAIRAGIKSGMFEPEDMAGTYGVPLSVVEAIIKS